MQYGIGAVEKCQEENCAPVPDTVNLQGGCEHQWFDTCIANIDPALTGDARTAAETTCMVNNCPATIWWPTTEQPEVNPTPAPTPTPTPTPTPAPTPTPMP